MPHLDWSVVWAGAFAGLVLVIPSAIISAILVSGARASSWAFLFELLVLTGFVVAGFWSGTRRSDTPMIHGAAAALLCYVVVQVLGLLRRLNSGDDINFLTYPVNALLAATFGVAGAVFADWYRRRSIRA